MKTWQVTCIMKQGLLTSLDLYIYSSISYRYVYVYYIILRQKSYSVAGPPFGGQPIDTNRLSEDETISDRLKPSFWTRSRWPKTWGAPARSF